MNNKIIKKNKKQKRAGKWFKVWALSSIPSTVKKITYL
jgi:hypothetical protein